MPESIGEQLRKLREQRHLTFEHISQSLRIRPHYLQALEADDYSAIPSATQARGFLRNYAEYLGLNIDELLEARRAAMPPPEPPAEPVTTSASEASHERGGFLKGLRQRLARREPEIIPPTQPASKTESFSSKPVEAQIAPAPSAEKAARPASGSSQAAPEAGVSEPSAQHTKPESQSSQTSAQAAGQSASEAKKKRLMTPRLQPAC